MPYDLRPLTLAELLDRAFGLYRHHFWLFVGIMAVPSLMMLIISVGSQFLERSATLSAAGSRPEFPTAFFLLVVFGFAATGLVYWVSYAVALGATTMAVSGIYADRPPTIVETYRASRGKIGRLALLLILIGIRMFGIVVVIMLIAGVSGAIAALVSPILVGLGVFLAIVLMFGLVLWLFLRYAVSVPAAVLENNTATEAIVRSVELTKGSLHRVFLLMVFTVIVTYAALALFQVPFIFAAFFAGPETPAGFWLNLAGVVTGSIASALTSPLAVVAMAVLYYDLRSRNEGLDVELLVARLHEAPPVSQPKPSSALPG
jgi:hypothetical protein